MYCGDPNDEHAQWLPRVPADVESPDDLYLNPHYQIESGDYSGVGGSAVFTKSIGLSNRARGSKRGSSSVVALTDASVGQVGQLRVLQTLSETFRDLEEAALQEQEGRFDQEAELGEEEARSLRDVMRGQQKKKLQRQAETGEKEKNGAEGEDEGEEGDEGAEDEEDEDEGEA